ncbi:MAG: hypothetical protein VX733_10605 [Candidatus Latescibacterota bacterium]|nr:hypothetical protein [Candidatus Latescibacterota bacterium]
MSEESRRAKRSRQYEEINEYRDLLQAPNEFEHGFTKKTVIGVLFIAFIMTPGQLYLSLTTGLGIGDAAQWVTVILFLEIAKRSFTTLRRQEIFLLTYAASQLIARAQSQTFQELIFRQYFVASQEAQQFGLTEKLANLKFMGRGWYTPPLDSPALIERTFFHPDWVLPIALLVVGIVVSKITWFTSGYVLFRLVSDRERLPFPTAPQQALGAMALAEESGSEEQTWKWPCFTIGGAIGLVFGLIYVAVPALTETFSGTRVVILPNPFADLTPILGRFLGGTPIAIPFTLSPIFVGLLAPFWGIMGGFAGVLSFITISPILHHFGMMPRWVPGMGAVQTQITAGVDFWSPFAMGVTLSLALISIIQVVRAGRERMQDQAFEAQQGQEGHQRDGDECRHPECHNQAQVRGYCMTHLNRGDFPLWVCITLFFIGAAYPIVLAKTLFPTLITTGILLLIVLMAFVYAPLMSFVSARLDGLLGRNIQIPHLHEATVFLTGYRGVEIWFVPLAGSDFGGNAEVFRVIELTGMRFTSLLKAELVMVPIVLGGSLLYWSFLWRLAPIPSDAYPYVQTFWPAMAFNSAVRYSATQYSLLYEAGEEVEGRQLQPGEFAWSPANLQDDELYYWRMRVTEELDVRNLDLRRYSPWTKRGYFYTDFEGDGVDSREPQFMELSPERDEQYHLPLPQMVTPDEGDIVTSPEPYLRASVPREWQDRLEVVFELDTDSTFRGDFYQGSNERPMFFKIYWEDLDYTGNGRDDDFDGVADEEYLNQRDDDGDGEIDEDTHHPLQGRKWPILALGTTFALALYSVLSFFGMPMFFVWGFIGAVAQSGAATFFAMFTEFIGALLARRYFWKRYGKQEWRRYAMVLAVGYGVGLALVGMFCSAILMIRKAVSATEF